MLMDKELAKEKLKRLIEKFERLVLEGKIKNEENTKNWLIEPLFELLGWDMRSEEISKEERVSKGRADYAFRIGGVIKFFVEAKSVKEDLNDPKFAQQTIEYGWNKGITWAALTDFEGLKVFNCEWNEKNIWRNVLFDLNYKQYLDEFDKLWLFNRDAVKSDELGKYADKIGKRIPKRKISDYLLSEFIDWRTNLLSNLKKDYPNYSEVERDEIVQTFLDRIIFIRSCEDRGYEERLLDGALRQYVNENRNLNKLLKEIFEYYNKNYDSKIFEPMEIDKILFSDHTLKSIIKKVYKTEDGNISYDFSLIDADILGNLYEQYLSHISKKSEEKNKAKKKSQGIYYTPTYIVDYIVRNTVGELLKTKKVDINKIRILDPACGSGSFLIKAFDIIKEYHKTKDKNYEQMRLDVDVGLPYSMKESILKNNIFGVDLDKQAVEIAQLNLLLKIAEKGHKLPVLRKNIQNGNSLIDDSLIAGDTAFKWEERFKEITKEEGGFDVIIGNPPYVRQEEFSEIKPYLQKNYEVYRGMADLFVYFFEREINLLKEGGYFGMIVSNKWLRAGYGAGLRKFLSKFWIEQFIDFGDLKVFPDATIYPCIIIIKKINKPNPKIQVCKMDTLSFTSLDEYIKKNQFLVNQNELDEKEWNIQSAKANQLLKKITSSGTELESYLGSNINRGILTGLNTAFVVDEKTKNELVSEDSKSTEIIKPLLSGSEIKRYNISSKSKYLIFTRRGIEINKYPAIKKYLQKFEAELTPKISPSQKKGRKPGDYKWYEIQDVIAYHKEFEKHKIVWGNLATKASFAFDDTGSYVNAPGCILPTNSKYVLGIINSKLISYFLKSICAERQGGFIEQKPVYVSKIPIRVIPDAQQQSLVKFVDKMIFLNKSLSKLGDKKTEERIKIEEEIKKTDAEIDELVYKLYGITAEEKRIIEESLK